MKQIYDSDHEVSFELAQPRCPRCGGMLVDASTRYTKFEFIYKNKKHCLICGRNWQLDRNNGKRYTIKQFPDKRDLPLPDCVIVANNDETK